MQQFGKYILSVTAAAILVSVLQNIVGKKGANAALLNLISGLFMAFTVIAPITNIQLEDILDMPWDFVTEGTSIATQGQATSEDLYRQLIKQKCEAYILDKAQAYQATLEVEVTLDQSDTPTPDSVRMQGQISPYGKAAMQQWLQEEMGVPKERQQWIG